MNNQIVSQSVAIIIAVASVFLIQLTDISNYISYLLGILIVFSAIYISIKKRSKSASELFTGSPLEIGLITSIILLILVLTGNLSSPLFFFLYFLLFFFAFIAEPATIIFFILAILLYFLPNATGNFSTDILLKLGSLVLIGPIAYFVARELERRSLLGRRVEAKTDEIIREAVILKENAKDADENEAIDEIIEEAESLKDDAKV